MTRDQKNWLTEPSPRKTYSGVLLAITGLTEQSTGQVCSALSLRERDFNCCLRETQVADGLCLKMRSLQSKFAEWPVTPDAAQDAADWPSPARPGQGQPNPTVPVSTRDCLSSVESLLVWGQRTARVSVFMLLVKCKHAFFDQDSLHCSEHNLSFHGWSTNLVTEWALSGCSGVVLALGDFCTLCRLVVCWLNVMQMSWWKVSWSGARGAGFQVLHECWLLIFFWLYDLGKVT